MGNPVNYWRKHVTTTAKQALTPVEYDYYLIIILKTHIVTDIKKDVKEL